MKRVGTRPLWRGRIALALVVCATGAFTSSVGATSALAYQYEHIYCAQSLAPDGTCPPNGASEYAHLEANVANANGESHETCADDYFAESKTYSAQSCMYYKGENAAIDTPSGPYGYPRAWNGGQVNHYVLAIEAGYHTGAAAPAPAAAQPALTGWPGGAAFDGIEPGLDLAPSSATLVAAAYPVWVVPGTSGVCIFHASASAGIEVQAGVCGTTADLNSRGIAVTTETASGAPLVIGLTPVGNNAVTVTNTNGTTEQIPVKNNVYEITAGKASSVTLDNAAGEVTTRHLATP